jgi:hypothetical protein
MIAFVTVFMEDGGSGMTIELILLDVEAVAQSGWDSGMDSSIERFEQQRISGARPRDERHGVRSS